MKQSMLEEIGGEEVLRKLVDDFYDLIETMPEGEQIKKLHLRGHGLDHVRLEQFNFLSGFLGGRRYYEEKFGHMNVRQMHEHVPISQQDAEDWLTCMDAALTMNGLEGAKVERLRAVFRRVALMLVNDLGAWGMPAAAQGSSST
ncbi:group II truncated hemoglobin [Sulfitobacter aestuarii]|uniref:Group II truncated hemoglobin n=1 Tax=Sulfitobacter aestuarii TaxID=2161676 RepID=A0ABW5TYC3_9RHOB